MDGSYLLARRQLRLGALLAEGGEGRVYELADRPDQVCKLYRAPQRRAGLAELVAWSTNLEARAPALAGRVRASTAWPVAVVVEDHHPALSGAAGVALGRHEVQWASGLVLPRAPRRFNLLHRDGRPHLASLSYLTADPERRSAAYGDRLPAPMSPDRLGLVYALARLLEVFEAGSPSIVHGDLSAKNVLWSLARGPEVFVLDCDNGERYRAGQLLGLPDRRRAMTPNWDDPAVPAGGNPGLASDRYSLALIFLRACGAAHYPIQKLQKAGEAISLDVAIPVSLRRARALSPGGPLWELCARGLSATEPAARPPAAAWVRALEAVIGGLGAPRVLQAVWASQGRARVEPPDGSPASAGATEYRGEVPGDVAVQPVAARARVETMIHRPPLRVGVPLGHPTGWTPVRTGAGGLSPRGRPGLPSASAAQLAPTAQAGSGVSVWAQVGGFIQAVATWLVEEHRRTLRYLRAPERRRHGLVRVAWCMAVDFALACALLFVAAMISSPFLGI